MKTDNLFVITAFGLLFGTMCGLIVLTIEEIQLEAAMAQGECK